MLFFRKGVYVLKSHMDIPPPNANVEPIAVAISQGKTSSKHPIPCGSPGPLEMCHATAHGFHGDLVAISYTMGSSNKASIMR